jgi:hypothetical protein
MDAKARQLMADVVRWYTSRIGTAAMSVNGAGFPDRGLFGFQQTKVRVCVGPRHGTQEGRPAVAAQLHDSLKRQA